MSLRWVRGGAVALPDGSLRRADLELTDGVITGVAEPPHDGGMRDRSSDEVRADDRIVAPGYVDLQINGGWGVDFTSDATAIDEVAGRLPETGVAAFVPTIVSSPRRCREAALARVSELWHDRRPGAAVLGLHFEGPAIAAERAGAHDPAHIAVPDADEVATWSRSGGVAIVTLAPEVPGAAALVRTLTERGVVVSIGHTACSPADFGAARDAGATMVTHLFNAMAPFSHRAPGPVGASFADAGLVAGLICDGVHVDPVAVAMAWRTFGPDRFLLVSDAVAALGTGSDRSVLAEAEVSVDPSGVRTLDGVLAGSNLTLDSAVRNLVTFTGCTVGEAIRTATTTPADALGLADRGRIVVGARADLVVLDDDLRPVHTIIGGSTAWKS